MGVLGFSAIYEKISRIVRPRYSPQISARFGASDVIQESAIQAWRHIADNQLSESRVDTQWLRTVAAGHYCKLLRFHLAAKRCVNTESNDHTQTSRALASDSSDPVITAQQREQTIKLLDLIDQMEPVQKQVVVDRFFREKKIGEIADELCISVYHVRKLIAESVGQLEVSFEVPLQALK